MPEENFNIEPKPVETIPVSSLLEEAKKTLDKISEKEMNEITEKVLKAKSRFNASDWLNVIKGLAQQKGLQAIGFEPNTNFSLKTVAIVAVVIMIIIAAFTFLGGNH